MLRAALTSYALKRCAFFSCRQRVHAADNELRFPRLSRFTTPKTCPVESRGLFCAQLLARVLDPLAEAAVARHLAADFIDAVNHGRVIAAAERLADLDELHLQQLAREIHRD